MTDTCESLIITLIVGLIISVVAYMFYYAGKLQGWQEGWNDGIKFHDEVSQNIDAFKNLDASKHK